MARTKQWSYSTGERGRNRVRAFEHSSGVLMLEFSDRGRRTRLSLGHRDRKRAKQDADNAAARIGKAQELRPERLTLAELFEKYLEEVTPAKSRRSQHYDRAACAMFAEYYGSFREPHTLSIRDWDRFISDRRKGRVGPGLGPWKGAGDRTVERDLRLMLAVLNWATVAGDSRGLALLERNPFKGYAVPKEKNPTRTIMTEDEYQALLYVAPAIDWRFQVALIVAHESGHRIGSIRQLRWSDIDLEARTVRWRAEHEKTGYENTTPLSPEAMDAFALARSHFAGIGEAPVLPAPKDAAQPVGRYRMRDWWKRAERAAELQPTRGRGWHSLRRKFASDCMHLPLKVLCQLGGWRSHETVLECYQHADAGELRRALADRRRVVGA